MAHGLTDSDNMMYVGAEPWHRHPNAKQLPNLATAEEAIAAAHLDWEVVKTPVTSSKGIILGTKHVLEHAETGVPYGTVGNQYIPVQNREAFTFFDSVTQDPKGPKYVTAGSLHGGTVIWILAQLPSFINVTKEDVVMEYILLTYRHDGKGLTVMKWTPIRVVCQNTLNASLGSVGRQIGFNHLLPLLAPERVEAAQDALCIARESHLEFEEIAKAMVAHKPTITQVNDVIAKLFPAKDEEKVPAQTGEIRHSVLTLFDEGKGNDLPSVVGSSWALYNAVTEYTDYYRPVNARVMDEDDTRANSILFGSSAKLKEKAFSVIADMVRA